MSNAQFRSTLVGLLACLPLMGPAQAVPYLGGAGFNIVDNTTQSSTINAVNLSDPIISSFDSVIIDVVSHTWIGDLTATLTSPNGDSVQLFRRPGDSGVGNSNDWQAGLYTFVASGGGTVPNIGAWAPGTYDITNNPATTQLIPAPNPNTYSVFNGTNLNGLWTLAIQDSAAGDVGSIAGWSMNITSVAGQSGVPEIDPRSGAAPLAATLVLLGFVSSRRRVTVPSAPG